MAATNFNISYEVKERGKTLPQYTLNTDQDGKLTLGDLLRYTKDALITISTDVLREEQGRGFDKNPVRLVDGKPNKAVNDVDPLGRIEYFARQDARKLILQTYQEILKRSPVFTGEYERANVVTFNGRQIANDLPSLEAWLESAPEFGNRDRIRFINTSPYARKLERLGVTRQRRKFRTRKLGKRESDRQGRKVLLVPNGAYSLAYRAIRSKYKANSFIAFDLVPGSSLGITEGFGQGTHSSLRRTFAKNRNNGSSAGRPYLYPTILIYVVKAGLVTETLQ